VRLSFVGCNVSAWMWKHSNQSAGRGSALAGGGIEMGTKRTPIHRDTRQQITPAAVEAFREMEKLRTQCGCLLMKQGRRCSACGEWWKQHSILHDAVGAKPWQWPCFLDPDDDNPYPAGSPARRRSGTRNAHSGRKRSSCSGCYGRPRSRNPASLSAEGPPGSAIPAALPGGFVPAGTPDDRLPGPHGAAPGCVAMGGGGTRSIKTITVVASSRPVKTELRLCAARRGFPN
jgi:hypothetical protein